MWGRDLHMTTCPTGKRVETPLLEVFVSVVVYVECSPVSF